MPAEPPTASAVSPSRPVPRPVRWLLAACAVACFGLGWIGVFVPGLPTTVFWLLAVVFAGKSCPVVQRWVYRRGRLGRTVEDIVVRRAMTRAAKTHAVIGMWAMLTLSAVVLWQLSDPTPWWLVATLPAVGTGVSLWIVFGLRVLPTQRLAGV
ncbi:MAG: YbaN family protein [Planctomycetota bacterium]